MTSRRPACRCTALVLCRVVRRADGTLAIVAVGAVGAAVRVAFAIGNADGHPATDSDVYREIAHNLADGAGYVQPDSANHLMATAAHPPGLAYLLAGLDLVGLTTKMQQRLVLSLVAAIGVVL